MFLLDPLNKMVHHHLLVVIYEHVWVRIVALHFEFKGLLGLIKVLHGIVIGHQLLFHRIELDDDVLHEFVEKCFRVVLNWGDL